MNVIGRTSGGVLCILLATAAGCDKPRTGVVPLPVLPDKIELRVVNVVNPRLPRMTEAQIGKLLSAAKDGVKQYFDLDISFGQIREISVREFFDVGRIPADKRKRIAEGIYDFKKGKGNRYLMVKSFAQSMEQEKLDLREAIGFAAPYLATTLSGRDYGAFADALVTTQLKRLDEWREKWSRKSEQGYKWKLRV